MTVWGTPWHGLFSNGLLALPNGTNKPYPATVLPPSVAPHPLAGSTYRVKRPGWPDPVRTPEEAAEDALSGRTWRGEAVLSGMPLHLAGRPFPTAGGWVYFAADGARWRVSLVSLVVDSGELKARIGLRPLGRPGPYVGDVDQDVSVEITQTPSVFVGQLAYQVGVASGTGSTTEPAVRPWLFDIASDGHAAIVQLALPRTRFMPGDTADSGLPVGWCEIQLTGGSATARPVATVRELYSRTETFGTPQARTGAIPIARAGVVFNTEAVTDPSPPSWVLANYPPAEGWTYEIRTITAEPVVSPAPEEPRASGFTSGSGGTEIELTDRIIAMWYSAEGEATPVRLSARWGVEVVDSHQGEVIGAVERRVAVKGGTVGVQYATSGAYDTRFEMATQTTGYLEIEIDWGAYHLEWRDKAVEALNQEIRYGGSGDWSYEPSTVTVTLWSDLGAWSGSSTSGPTATTQQARTQPLPTPLRDPTIAAAPYWWAWVDWAGWSVDEGGQVGVFGIQREAPPAGIAGAAANRLYFNTLQVLGRLTYGGAESAGGSAWQVRQSPVLTPGGTDSRTHLCGYNEYDSAGWHLHASRDPATGEVARFHTNRVTFV